MELPQNLQECAHDGSNYDDELIIKKYSAFSEMIHVPEPRIWRKAPRILAANPLLCSPNDMTANSVHGMLSNDSAIPIAIADRHWATSAIHLTASGGKESSPRDAAPPLHFGQKPEAAVKSDLLFDVDENSSCLVLDFLPPIQPSTGPPESNPVVAMDAWSRSYLALLE